MKTDIDKDALDALDQFGDRAVISLREVAHLLNRAPETITGWCAHGLFPNFIQLVPGGKKEFRVAKLKAFFAKRQRSRYVAPKPRGALMRGRQLKRQRDGGDK